MFNRRRSPIYLYLLTYLAQNFSSYAATASRRRELNILPPGKILCKRILQGPGRQSASPTGDCMYQLIFFSPEDHVPSVAITVNVILTSVIARCLVNRQFRKYLKRDQFWRYEHAQHNKQRENDVKFHWDETVR